MRRAARRDGNEVELVAMALQLGAQIVKAPPLDFWCWVPRRATWRPVEVKNKRGKYTEAQKKFFWECALNGSVYWTWRTADDVLQCLQGRE